MMEELLARKLSTQHCDSCARNKAKLMPIPKERTTRPTRSERVKKIYLDASGMMHTKSIYNNFYYYLLATTDVGFMLMEGLTYKDQTLFAVGRMFDELGGAPEYVVVDAAGELSSDIARKFFVNRQTARVMAPGGKHYKLGRTERRHATITSMARSSLAHACAPLEFWYYCIRHMMLIANLILLARDPDTRTPMEMTVWQAHYGVRPNLHKYLIAPWGCLAYLCLTSEQRSKKKMDKKWGPRAIAGIFIGCYVNPKTDIYHFLIHDGRTIFATSGNLRVVGDCFPFKYQQGRDIQMKTDADDSDEEEVVMTAGTESGEHNEETDMLTCAGFEAQVQEAYIEYRKQNDRHFVFVGKENGAKAANSFQRRQQDSKGEVPHKIPMAKAKQKVHKVIAKNRAAGPRSADEYLVEVADKNAEVSLSDPSDFVIPTAPPNFILEEPYPGAKYEVAVPIDHENEKLVAKGVTDPNKRFVGRRVRKSVVVKRKIRGEVKPVLTPFEGVVKLYNSKTNLFRITYDDDDEEQMDLVELEDVIIMCSKNGDHPDHEGKTRAEMVEKIKQDVLIAETREEVWHNRISSSFDYKKRVMWRDNSPRGEDLQSVVEYEEDSADCAVKRRAYQECLAKSAERRRTPTADCSLHDGTCDCTCATCQYFYKIERGEVVWCEVKGSRFKAGADECVLGSGAYKDTKTQLEERLREARHGIEQMFTTDIEETTMPQADVKTEPIQGIEDSTPSVDEDVKVDDAPQNFKEG